MGLTARGTSGPGTSDTDSAKFDVGGADMIPRTGCEKVDFLFVVDNSGSMGDEQQNLANSFPGFVTTIQSTLSAQDYHIMVVDTGLHDFYEELVECQEDCQDPEELDCKLPGLGNVDCTMLPTAATCDTTLGAGRIHSQVSPPTECGIAGSQRYLIDGQPTLSATFECLALVGTDGDGSERPMESMANAVRAPLNGPGGCNEGFLRDDAILVVTVITDEEDIGKSAGDPATWAQALIDAKLGVPNSVVVLGLIGDTGQPSAVCPPSDPLGGGDDAEDAPRIREFVQKFGSQGIVGSVCEPDYNPFFQQAVSVIDLACDEFEPAG
jgi:hypothetical protein